VLYRSCRVLPFPKTKEAVAVPLGAGDVPGDGRQRLVPTPLPVEPVLISKRDNEGPLLEDLNGQIALSAGRGPMSSIDGTSVDSASFGREGAIALGVGPEISKDGMGRRIIRLAPQIAEARASQQKDTAQN